MKKNKITATALALSAITSVISPVKVNAEEYCETLKYIIREDKAVITGFSGNPEKLVIPAKIEGKEVVSIRENAFYKCESLKEISLPDTVAFIGHHAFFECTSLDKATLSDNIYSMGEGIFSGCISLDEVNIPRNLKSIEEKSFFNCISLKEIDLPGATERIENYAFGNCKALEKAILNDTILSIGDYAFTGCENLGRVFIPDSVLNLGCNSLGYINNKKTNKSFVISGSEKSLGKLYAKENNIKYDSIEKTETKRKIPIIPGIIMVASATGLVLFKSLSKIKKVRYGIKNNAA